MILRLVTYRTLNGIAQRWMAWSPQCKRRGYGKSRMAAVADFMGDEERLRRFGHSYPPGFWDPHALSLTAGERDASRHFTPSAA